ncbi:LysR family transcriptional regulator [Pseudogemmobacter sonorensis]|uniref:LysR family transcriptional regulator n=1 Tax=Pseudogemmobacter sonorensis TaxID=2989681 RepID=UPI0036988852
MIPRRYLPSIPALLALEALERLGSASAAAAEMALTQGAVSRQIQALEGQLGVALVLRERQRLILTPAARDYVEEVRKALKILSEASLSLRANPSGGALNLAILPAFGMHWLAPRLARFAQAHPEVTVNLSTRLRPFDFAGNAFDAAVHYGRRDWPGVSFLKLMDEDFWRSRRRGCWRACRCRVRLCRTGRHRVCLCRVCLCRICRWRARSCRSRLCRLLLRLRASACRVGRCRRARRRQARRLPPRPPRPIWSRSLPPLLRLCRGARGQGAERGMRLWRGSAGRMRG